MDKREEITLSKVEYLAMLYHIVCLQSLIVDLEKGEFSMDTKSIEYRGKMLTDLRISAERQIRIANKRDERIKKSSSK